MSELAILQWALLQNYHADKSNAAIHCASVKFSPITFHLCETLRDLWPEGDDITQEMAEIRAHLGAYELDAGR